MAEKAVLAKADIIIWACGYTNKSYLQISDDKGSKMPLN